MIFLDVITFISYVALTTDIIFQIYRVQLRGTAGDVSLIGLSIRYVAILVILYKFYTLGEWPLLLGQLLLAAVFTLYLILVSTYYRNS